MACVYQVKKMYNGHIGEYESWHDANFSTCCAQLKQFLGYHTLPLPQLSSPGAENIHLASRVEQNTFTLLTNLSRMVALTVRQERT